MNVYLIRGSSPVLVDTGTGTDGSRLSRFLRSEGVEPRELGAVVLTHAHFDHVGSAKALRNQTSAPFIGGERDAGSLSRGENPLSGRGWISRALGRVLDISYSPVAIDVPVGDPLDLTPYGVRGTVLQVGGHTPGSLVVVLPGGEAIVGDLIVGGVLGGVLFPSRPQHHFFRHDLDEVHAALRDLLDRGVARFHLGHGGPVAAGDVEERLVPG